MLVLRREIYLFVREKDIAQISYFVYNMQAPEKTIDAEPSLEAA